MSRNRQGSIILKITFIILLMMFCMEIEVASAGSLTLPARLIEIEAEAFMGDESLEEIVLPEGIKRINSRAFADSSLQWVSIPSSVTFIADDAFPNPQQLTIHADENTYARQWAASHGYFLDDGSFVIMAGSTILGEDDDTTLYVRGQGSDAVYQWQTKFEADGEWQDIGVNSPTLGVSAATAGVSGLFYRCIVTDGVGLEKTSDTLTMTIGESACKVVVDEQPQPQYLYSVNSPTKCQVSVSARNVETYQWQWKEGSEWINISSGTKDTFSVGVATALMRWRQFGDAVIRCKLTDVNGKFIYTLPASIRILIDFIKLDHDVLSMNEGDIQILNANITSEWAYNKDIIWSSSDENIAIVDKTGRVIAKSSGQVTITASAADRGGATASCSITVSSAFEIANDDDFEWELIDDEHIRITKYKGTAVNLAVPDRVNGHSIKEIGSNSFANNTTLEYIRFAEGIELVDYYSFQNCTSLKHVHLPDSVREISDYGNMPAFAGCNSVETFDYPMSLESANQLMSCFPKITSYTIPEGVTQLPHGFFANASQITSIELPDSLEVLTNDAFSGTSISEITIPAKVTSIPAFAFANCSKVTNIKFLGKIELVDYYSFQNCTSLKHVHLPDSVREISDYGNMPAFAGCNSVETFDYPMSLESANQLMSCFPKITSYIIPEGVIQLPHGFFANASQITSIDLPDSLEVLTNDAFSGTSISEITIPAKVTSIPAFAFANCSKITNIKFLGKIELVDYYSFQNCTSLNITPINRGILLANAIVDDVAKSKPSFPVQITDIETLFGYMGFSVDAMKAYEDKLINFNLNP